MLDDLAELDRMIHNEGRLGRAQPKEELTRRAKTDFPSDPGGAETTTRPAGLASPGGVEDAVDTAEGLLQAGRPTVHGLPGDGDNEDMYEGMPDMSPEISSPCCGPGDALPAPGRRGLAALRARHREEAAGHHQKINF